jgi:hypothetical protein
MALSVEEAAARLGVKARELSSVKSVRDGDLVVDRAGARLLLTEDGVYWYDYVPGVPAKEGGPPNAGLPVWVAGEGPAEEPEPEPKKTAPAKK